MKRSSAIITLFFAFCILHFAFAAPAQSTNGSPRRRLLLDFGWKFHLGDEWGTAELLAKAGQSAGPAATRFNDGAWRSLNLPHDWAVELPFVQNAYRAHGFKPVGPGYTNNSVGWYRRSFPLPPKTATSASGWNWTALSAIPVSSSTATSSAIMKAAMTLTGMTSPTWPTAAAATSWPSAWMLPNSKAGSMKAPAFTAMSGSLKPVLWPSPRMERSFTPNSPTMFLAAPPPSRSKPRFAIPKPMPPTPPCSAASSTPTARRSPSPTKPPLSTPCPSKPFCKPPRSRPPSSGPRKNRACANW